MVDGTDGRSVTLALINSKLDTVLERLAEFHQELGDHEKRLRDVETASARHNERLGIVGTLNLLAAGIAAWLGMRK